MKTIKEQGKKQIKDTESNKGVDNKSHKILMSFLKKEWVK